MLIFQFCRISFAKASKYVFLVSNQKQTKRTDVCHLWTSSPTFQENADIEESEIYKIKACQATIDRKLKIVGFALLQNKYLNEQQQNGKILQKDMELIQSVQGKDVVVGRFHLIVRRKVGLGQKSLKNSEVKQQVNKFSKSLNVSNVYQKTNSPFNSNVNSARVNNNHQMQLINTARTQKLNDNSNDFDSDLQLKSDEEDKSENDCSIKVFVHGGTNFYLGSSITVQLLWGQKYCQTHYIKDKIIPIWAESLILVGNSQQFIILNILDQKKNILQWTRFSLKNIRKMYPYHLKLIFRQQYMGDCPVVYFSFMRQDLPKFSILDKQINLVVNYEGQNVRNPLQYLVLQSKSQLQLPKFYQIDLKKFQSFDILNKFIQNIEIGDYNWIDFIPLQTGKRSLTLFKSQLNKNLNLFLISLKNWAQVFCKEDNKKRLDNIIIVQKRQNFQNILKQIYYYQQVHAIGKITQIYSSTNLQQGSITDTNVWRTMTKNYILRNNLLNTSIKNTQILKSQIKQKGQQLVKLKKILNEVKSINLVLKQKEKSTLMGDVRNKKQRLQVENFKITDIEMMLYQKRAQLQFKKKRNDEMNIRMDSLSEMEQDITQLDEQIVKNATKILEQQKQIVLLKLMRKQIPKQKMLVSKLQTIFEKKQIDNQMNQLLKKQSERLDLIRKQKQAKLQRVYALIKEKNKSQNSLSMRVQAAEKELIKLNQVYAKLTGL